MHVGVFTPNSDYFENNLTIFQIVEFATLLVGGGALLSIIDSDSLWTLIIIIVGSRRMLPAPIRALVPHIQLVHTQGLHDNEKCPRAVAATHVRINTL